MLCGRACRGTSLGELGNKLRSSFDEEVARAQRHRLNSRHPLRILQSFLQRLGGISYTPTDRQCWQLVGIWDSWRYVPETISLSDQDD